MDKRLNLDWETYCDLDIKKVGAYKYARDPSCRVLLGGYSLNRKKTRLWDATATPKMPIALRRALEDPEVTIHAFNAPFERLILKFVLGIDLPLERFRCTMVHAYSLAFTGGLANVGEQIGIEKSKLTAGKELIKLFCQPRKPTKNKPWLVNTRKEEPEKWKEFKAYCIRDVDAEVEIGEFLDIYPMQQEEWETWFLDQRINDRGLPLDRELINAALKAAEIERSEVLGEIQRITKVENPNSKPQVRAWLNNNGCDIPNMQGDVIEEYEAKRQKIKNKAVLQLLLRIAKSSYTKYVTMLRTMCDDDRVYGTLQFLGAPRTGRWAGRLIQPQNFIRPPKGYDPDESIHQILSGKIEKPAMLHLAAALRGAIAAPDNQLFTNADLAGIEGRVLPWLCFDQAKLDKIISGLDMYLVAASEIYGIPYDQLDSESPERTAGKVAELALGFQGAVGALNTMARSYKLPEYSVDEALVIVRAWRKANQPIVKFWYQTERAAKAAVEEPGRMFESGRLKFVVDGEFLFMILPSGRELAYHLPEINEDGQLTYMGWNSYIRKWQRLETYGGKLVENATQATARDVFVFGMKLVNKFGFKIVSTIHDEILNCQRISKKYSLKKLIQLMSTEPPWAKGLPLNASGYVGPRFKKG